MRRGLDPVGALAVEDGVEIRGEDLRLRVLVLQLHGDPRLVDLAADGAAARLLLQVEVLRQLLGDGRAALPDAAGVQVVERRARDAAPIERAVLPVALVLDGDGRAAHRRRDVLPAHADAVLLPRDHPEGDILAGLAEYENQGNQYSYPKFFLRSFFNYILGRYFFGNIFPRTSLVIMFPQNKSNVKGFF